MGIQIYIANIGRTPFLINNAAVLKISDESGAKFAEECYMVLLVKNEDGDLVRRDTTSPLVLGSEADVSFSFLTKKVQREMIKGKLFREIYSSGKSNGQLEFSIEKVGFRRHKDLKTSKFIFKNQA